MEESGIVDVIGTFSNLNRVVPVRIPEGGIPLEMLTKGGAALQQLICSTVEETAEGTGIVERIHRVNQSSCDDNFV